MKPNHPKYIKQFACGVMDFTSQYGGEHPRSFSYNISNIVGEPRIYPGYGDYTQAAVLRTYGPWWNNNDENFDKRPKSKVFRSEDYIDLVFEQAVYPWSIAIYETYNPGAVVRILALCQNFPRKQIRTHVSEGDEDENNNVDFIEEEQPIPMPFNPGCTHWEVLWETHDIESNKPPVSNEARMFAPILREIKNTTRIIRLELCSRHLDYYAEIDAVELTGTLMYCPTSCVDPPLELVKKLSLNDGIPDHFTASTSDLRVVQLMDNEPKTEFIKQEQSEVGTDSDNNTLLRLVNNDKHIENGFFDRLPPEILQYIFSFLSLPDLCKIAKVSRLFRDMSYHPSRYVNLDLSSYWSIVNDDALFSLKSRCCIENCIRYYGVKQGCLKRINLSWYGGGDIASSSMLNNFITECGSPLLTTLSLASSPAVTDSVLVKITDHCPNLQHLDIQSVDKPTAEGLRVLHKLTKLVSINVYRTEMDDAGIICVLHSNPKLQHVNIGSCFKISDYDRVCQEMAIHCRQLQSLDCWRSKSLTSTGLNALVDNCNLQELDFGWCGGLQSSTHCFQNLALKCRNLRKLYVTANRTICDNDINMFAHHCKNLQKLDILGTRLVTEFCIGHLLEECKGMKFLDVSFCAHFSKTTVDKLKMRYPLLDVKRSFQNEA